MTKDDKPTRDALVIGIGQYADLNMPSEITKLVAGAEKIAQLLEKQGGFRVRRLPVTIQGDKEFVDAEQMLTAPKLKMAIEQLLIPKSDSRPTTALIFFAGHGLQKEIKADRYEGFLATSEASPAEDEWGISLQWLRELLDKSPIPQQIVWLDACHSGEFQTCEVSKTSQVLAHDICFVSSARAHEEAYAEGVLTTALLETLDYTKQLNPWVDHLTLIEWLKAKNQTAAGSQRFVFAKTDKPIILTNKAFDVGVDYKNVCPFKGLESFDFAKNPDDPLYFKGRTELTNELVEKVQGANFLAVLGASGNGKSSVVRAGLLYQLRQTQRWEILPVITPTSQPLTALGSVIGMPAAQLTDFINRAQAERVVLVIDQFEEIFTVCKNDAEREQFLATLLATVTRTNNKFCLVVVMRADFLDKCSQHVNLAKQIQAHQIIVTPMTAAELEEAIVAPTQQVGLQIEPKLVSEMLADVKGALGSLPLLQYTLRELWTKCAPHRLLTFSAYEELGKISGTLEKGANGVYEELSSSEQKIAKRIFIELTQLGEGAPDTRRQLSQQDLVTLLPFESTQVSEVIQKLVAANLVVTDKPKEEQVAIVNIAHEALTQHWGQLRGWLDGNRDAIKIQRDIEADAKKFEDSNQSKNALLQGLDLNIAKDYAKTHTEKVPLSTLALDFVQRSVKRQRHYWQGVVGSVVGVMLVLAGIAFYANEQRIVADEQRVVAENQRQLAEKQAKTSKMEAQAIEASAQFQSGAGEIESLLLAMQAGQGLYNFVNKYKIQELQDYPTVRPLLTLQTILSNIREKNWFEIDQVQVNDIVLSPDGKTIATGGYDGKVKLFDMSGNELTQWQAYPLYISSVKFSPDGKFIITGNNDNSVNNYKLWDTTRTLIAELEGAKSYDRNLDVNFSPDGKQIFGIKSHVVQIWDMSGKRVDTIKSLNKPTSIDFNKDGTQLVIGNTLGEIQIYDLVQKQKVMQFQACEYQINKIVFGSNDKILAHCILHDGPFGNQINPNFQVTKVFDLTGKHITTLDKDIFWDEAFTPDGKQIVTVGNSGVQFWNLLGKEIEQIKDHTGTIGSLSFGSDGKQFITGGKGYVRIRNFKKSPLVQLPISSNYSVTSNHFSSDNKKLITTSYDNTMTVYDLPSKSIVTDFKGSTKNLSTTIALTSPDGSKFVKVELLNKQTGMVTLTDLSGQVIDKLESHTDDYQLDPMVHNRIPRKNEQHNYGARWDTSFDANVVATIGTYTRIWDFVNDKVVVLKDPKNSFSSSFTVVKVSPDCQYILTLGTYDGILRLWDTLGNPLTQLNGYIKNIEERIELPGTIGILPSGQIIGYIEKDSPAMQAGLRPDDRITRINGKGIIDDTEVDVKYLISKDKIPSLLFHGEIGTEITLNIMRGSSYNLGQKAQYLDFTVTRKNIKISIDIDDIEKNPTNRIQFSPNSKYIAAWKYGNKVVRIFDISGNLVTKFVTSNKVGEVSFNPEGNLIVFSGEGNLHQIWDLSGKAVATLDGLKGVSLVQFSPNGKIIASMGQGNILKLWDLSGRKIAQFDRKFNVSDFDFNQDGKYIVTSIANTLVVLEVKELEDFLTQGCNFLEDYFVIHPEVQRMLTVCKKQA